MKEILPLKKIALLLLLCSSLAFSQAPASNLKHVVMPQAKVVVPDTPTQHYVTLSWQYGSSCSYFLMYRGTASGGPYTQIGQTPDCSTLTYQDNSVTSGTTYYYVGTAKDSTGNESGYSNQAQAVVPTNPNPPTNFTAVGH